MEGRCYSEELWWVMCADEAVVQLPSSIVFVLHPMAGLRLLLCSSQLFRTIHILICKVYDDGDSSVSTYERRASLREFYAIIYPILQQLESSLIERDLKGKGRCKDIVSRRRMEDWKKVSNRDVEREDECGICMEACTKMVLPNCSHAMCIKCYRDW
ncbi:RING/U-box superfamily protein [Zea mays]|uniref:RING/U-box superfamily protein n=1 Tax=Zea mays TaxID=4577 RepID=A0A1D6LFA1_MAIZE|nr:RING/U-box superfamily protein [Zea mays]